MHPRGKAPKRPDENRGQRDGRHGEYQARRDRPEIAEAETFVAS
jgi:hypothetical protein